ncbi:unnamed protein product [Heligmosomoides polygyrus]|uniref:Peptidase A2 domain-containing protein n=1 Tax=Heligmosomoides polygyrus TaxID=6339 RepID=A0A183GJF9_HELPZ|nr:unnamed protein product [Heligmosomoides polygyrus]
MYLVKRRKRQIMEEEPSSAANVGRTATMLPRAVPKCPQGMSLLAKQGKVKRGRNREPSTDRAMFTFVKEWCGALRAQSKGDIHEFGAVGKPTLFNAVIFGIEVEALMDTGSVISILPAGLLKIAKSRGFDINKEVELVSND